MSFWDTFSGDGILGGLISGIGTAVSNRQNMKINQMNNEFNERMLDKQLAYQESMWNKTNEYNSASAQRARLEAAGLNPYLMMSGGNAGTATAQSGASASAASPIAMQNVGASMVSGFGSLAMSRANAINTNVNTAGSIIDNNYKSALYDANLSEAYERTRNYKAMYRLNSASAEFQERNMENALLQTSLQNDQIRSQIRQNNAVTSLTNLKANEQEILNKYLDQQQQLELAERVNRIIAIGQSMKESAARIRLMAKQEVLVSAQARGQQISNSNAEQIADSFVASVISENIYRKEYYDESEGATDAKNDRWIKKWTRLSAEQMYYQNKSKADRMNEFKYLPNTPAASWW